MEFKEPSTKGFTIYTKSGCHFCNKTKKLLQEKNVLYETIDCDDYLIEDKEKFLLFIQTKTNVNQKMFPIIFNDGIFIGGYQETYDYLDKLIIFDEKF